ncbi:hypothetical protein KSP40_PGU008119 [Platanthera guangdongensis]|uniref:Uncharacterized protein n=1 Tax=Platanthera guangdongensis TaxID=2320717 RepID=A0ABR2MPF2_9ASPA
MSFLIRSFNFLNGGEMDVACGIWNSGIIGYPVYLDSSVRSAKFNSGVKDCNFAGDTRVFCRLRSTRKRKHGVSANQYSLQGSACGIRFPHRNLWRGAVWLQCQGNDSLAYLQGQAEDLDVTESFTLSTSDPLDEGLEVASCSVTNSNSLVDNGRSDYKLEDCKELLQKAMKDLEVAKLNSIMFEQKAQRISESAFALKDEAENARKDVSSTVSTVQEIINEETIAKEAVQKATMALSMAEARLQLTMGELDPMEELSVLTKPSLQIDFEENLFSAQEEIKDCKANLENYEAELKRIQTKKGELQREVDRLIEVTENAQLKALKAEEDVNGIMLLAEQAVAFELEVTQRVNDAELALQKAEKAASLTVPSLTVPLEQERPPFHDRPAEDVYLDSQQSSLTMSDSLAGERDPGVSHAKDVAELSDGEIQSSGYLSDRENAILSSYSDKESENDSKNAFHGKKQEVQAKDPTKDSPLNAPKGLLNKSSRFFSASFFSFNVEGKEFTPSSIFQGLAAFAKKQAPNLVLGTMLLGLG